MSVIAVDIGASSGRIMLAELCEDKFGMTEIHRFENRPMEINGTIYWDFPELFSEVKKGIGKAALTYDPESIGIDTWGVDFGLIGKDGNLLENPVHYRDKRTENILETIMRYCTKEEIYRQTGIQFMPTNTLYQMTSLALGRPDFLRRAENALLIPDLLAYFLTGVRRTEQTNASTTQMLSSGGRSWCTGITERMNIPASLFPPMIYPGEFYGDISRDAAGELNIRPVPVMAVPTHDTASAVVSVPASSDDFVYISCGTWSLLGTESPHPYVTETAFNCNFTNEIGYNGTTRLLKNIMGLWIIQESRRQWQREGNTFSFAELEWMAGESRPFACFIDPDAPDFVLPGDMPNKIRDYCRKTGQSVPGSAGEVVRCIYESLALKCRLIFEQLQGITQKPYATIHLIGGGARDRLLAQMIASACSCTVECGPIEATAIGNALVQMIAHGKIRDLGEAREIVRRSFEIKRFVPRDFSLWETAAERFRCIISK